MKNQNDDDPCFKKIDLKSHIIKKLEIIPQNRKYIEYSKIIVKEVKKHIKKIHRPYCH